MNELVIGLPSKGRLQENANAFFARAGLKVRQAGGGREYQGRLQGIDNVRIAFLSASEIAGELERGRIHFGVTGEDLIRERIVDPDSKVHLLVPLGFGYADVVVAVPQSWIDVASMADLEDVAIAFHAKHGRRLRVATKYLQLTRSFFLEHGIGDYRIVESAGATEGAPAAGTAEAIVDITTTGSTLAANNLKILDDGVILKSEAHLVASLKADWGDGPRRAARQLLDRVAAEAEAAAVTELRFEIEEGDTNLLNELEITIGCLFPFGRDLGATSVLCAKADLYKVVAKLHAHDKETVIARQANYVFHAVNPLTGRLSRKLGVRI